MGKASSNKKVDRAARAGGKVRAAQSRSLVFPSVIGVVVLLGVVLIAVSAGENRSDASIEPRLGTHWHAAFGVYHCDEFLPPLADDPSVRVHNLHTHADGLVHIHPASSAATGYDATLDVFFDTTDTEVSATRIEVSGFDPMEAGGQCGDEDAEIRLAVWDVAERNAAGQATTWDEAPTIIEGDPGDYRPQDDQVITLAYVAESLPDAEIPQPPSVSSLAAPVDEQNTGGGGPVPVPVPGQDTDPGAGDGSGTGAEGTDGTGTDAPADAETDPGSGASDANSTDADSGATEPAG